MASLSLDNSEVVSSVLQVMGLSRDATNLDDSTEADVRAIIRSGLRRFLFPTQFGAVYQWRWLEKHHAIPIVPIFDDGTIQVASGTITLTGGVWPTDLTNYFVAVSGHVLFITSRDDDTTATTSNTQLSVDAGTSYDAFKYQYDLPSDFGEWLGGVVYADGTYSRILAGSSESEIRLRYAIGQGTRSVTETGNIHTTHYAVSSVPTADAHRITFWPVPRPDAFVQGVYLSIPDDNLPADLTVPGSVVQVQPIYAEAVLENILAAAEEYNDGAPGVHSARAQAALDMAMQHDAQVGGPYDFSHRAAQGKSVGEVLNIDFSSQIS